MDFNFSEEQQSIVDAAERVFADLCDDDTIKNIGESDVPLHKELWAQLADSGMLGLVVDEEHGGLGMTLVELCLLFELQGKYLAPVPMIATLVECGLVISGSDNVTLKADLLPQVVSGELLLSPVRASNGVLDTAGLAAAGNDDLVLNGVSGVVPYASVAGGYVVTATEDDGHAVIVYCPQGASGLSVTEQRMSSGELAGKLHFENCAVPAAQVVARGASAAALAERQKQDTFVALAALQVGVLDEGLRRTAEYVSQRKQFGRPLGAFQAVSQQAANAYMAIESLRGAYWRALDDIEHGNDAALSTRVAKFWVGEAGHKAAHTILHLHGGIGQDVDYPAHRYFLWGKHNERYIGTPDDMALDVGKLIAADATRVLNAGTAA
ncbi:MAG: acyl-CoA/acyl-ACP dehydrogenase [Gammaproteobacteria bacterium]|nr:acyl-CoA/acyl-ACP dehydrogenase [Gammaproteobacteria bacterium]MDH3371891.1 acyl-CoA/acyl-ACP dehydrogenase [Gammaproteobacteria bacterium]MDH3407780.1 acyl-CoA/acyl-ACP dehydrogenase [Gammaproteobacteria bacterium]MDH3551437.1 acyl-CoA/acyl-ACP dehydrogenase [Gammaproteobacteria bacterium]